MSVFFGDLLHQFADVSAQYALELSGYVPLFQNPELGNRIPTISIPIEVTTPLRHTNQASAAQSSVVTHIPTQTTSTRRPSPQYNQPSGPSDEIRQARRRHLEEQMHRIQAELEMLAIAEAAESSGFAPYDTLDQTEISLDTEDMPPPSYAATVHRGA